MARKSNVRKLIRRLMADLGFDNQAAFARFLKLRPTTVSAWLTGASLPSPDAFVALAMRARDNGDALSLLEEAGLSPDKIVSLAGIIGSDRFRSREGGFVEVHRKRRTEAGVEPTGKSVQVASELVRHPVRSFVFELGEPNMQGENAVLVDTLDDPALDIRPFLGRLVLADFPSTAAIDAGSYFNGPHVGYLYVKHGDRRTLPGSPWIVRFCSEGLDYLEWEEAIVAEWVETPGWDREAEPITGQLRLPEGFILGRVIAWLRLAE